LRACGLPESGAEETGIPLTLRESTGLARPKPELDVIAPIAGKRQIERSRIASCMQAVIMELPRVVVRLTDGSVLIVTEASLDRAGLPIAQR
jgi:hypothetical protein